MPDVRRTGLLVALACLAATAVCAQTVITEGTNLSVDVSPDGERLVIDLLGGIWVMPAAGGLAEIVSDSLLPASRPRWSPDGGRILYQSDSPEGSRIRLLDLGSGASTPLSGDRWHDQQAAWHPDGERIVFASARHASGLDLWEMDLKTSLSWRLSHDAGDEMEPTWSANGRHLAYLRRDGETWSLMLRRHGAPDVVIVSARERLSSPSWRPDGTLLTFLRHGEAETTLEIAILSDPPLVHRLAAGEDFFAAPVSWIDRQRMFYAADGTVKKRGFEERASQPVFFRAAVDRVDARVVPADPARELPVLSAPSGRIVIRGSRLFDGVGDLYLEGLDILVDGAYVAAIEARRDWPDATVLDPGDVTVLPGFIDVYAGLPSADQHRDGAALLAYGVTTIVSDDVPGSFDAAIWEADETPGPRVLPAVHLQTAPDSPTSAVPYLITLPPGNSLEDTARSLVQEWQRRGVPILAESWTVGLGLGADLLLGAGALPSSPQGRRYDDIPLAARGASLTFVSALADAGTPGIADIANARQSLALGHRMTVDRRHAEHPRLAANRASIVLGSKTNGMPPGAALHAELRALAAAGLAGGDVLRAAGVNAANALGLENQVGQITPGALADFVLVTGDPLADPADALRIVAVVRNGRFFSLGRLLELATSDRAAQASVE